MRFAVGFLCLALALLGVARADDAEADKRGKAIPVLGVSSKTCENVCEEVKMECNEKTQKKWNTDLDDCFDAIEKAEIPGDFVKGVRDHTYMVLPTGCYATFRWSAYRVGLNTNSFGTDEYGCKAPAASIGWSSRICACKKK